MHQCPHCHEEGISSYQKIFSVSFSPAACGVCGKLSKVPVVHGLMALTAWIILTWVFIALSIMAQMSFFLLGTIPAWVFAVRKYLLAAPLARTRD